MSLDKRTNLTGPARRGAVRDAIRKAIEDFLSGWWMARGSVVFM
jgi:hypothetical protein